MAINLTTMLTGKTFAAFTSPTYTLAEDRGPNNWTKQSIVTAVGGTQVGVRTHSPSDPFTISVSKQAQPAAAPRAGTNGIVGKVGRNKVELLVRKGTLPLAGQAAQVSDIRVTINTVSGAEVNDVPNVTAMYAAAHAALDRELANFLMASQTLSI